jgi:hypothetical protein
VTGGSCLFLIHPGKEQTLDQDSTIKWALLHTREKCHSGKPVKVFPWKGRLPLPADHPDLPGERVGKLILYQGQIRAFNKIKNRLAQDETVVN